MKESHLKWGPHSPHCLFDLHPSECNVGQASVDNDHGQKGQSIHPGIIQRLPSQSFLNGTPNTLQVILRATVVSHISSVLDLEGQIVTVISECNVFDPFDPPRN